MTHTDDNDRGVGCLCGRGRPPIYFVGILPLWAVERDGSEIYQTPVRAYWSNRNVCEEVGCDPPTEKGSVYFALDENYPSQGAAFCWQHWLAIYNDPEFECDLVEMSCDEYVAERAAIREV